MLLCMVQMGQGINFSDKSVDELLKQAKKQNKLIFVDMYTVWCGPCKHMAKNIFTQSEAGEYFNENFINLKLDAEKEGKEFARKYNVTAYPTFFFIIGVGALVYRFMGGRPLDQFIAAGHNASAAFAVLPQLNKMENHYAKVKRTIDLLDGYYLLRYKS